MSWLGGMARGWVALVGLVGTVVGIVSFVVSEHLPWVWLAIGALLLLVVNLGTELWKVQRLGAGSKLALLDRAVSDGRALLGVSDHSAFVGHWDRHWCPATYEILREEFGLAAAMDFVDAMESVLRETGKQDPRAWAKAQVEFLERFRKAYR
jgi:hypothetical protein